MRKWVLLPGRIMPNSAHALSLNPLHYQAAHLALVAGFKLCPQESFDAALDALQPHDLLQQNKASLMNRVDTKYLLPRFELANLLAALADEYTILNEKGKRLFTYETTYFDSASKRFYLAHHNGKLNRHKVRFRRYVESNTGFMEVKLKNNKGRTIKKRVPMDCQGPDEGKINGFVQGCLGENCPNLETSLFVNYQRITLLNKHYPERLTIDLNLSFQCVKSGAVNKLPDVFIVELKREGKQQGTSYSRWASFHGFKPIKFSKYCMGLVLTHDKNIKKNRFKKTILQLIKITGTAPWN